MSMKPLQAPSPNLGDCSSRGQWSDPSFVGQCKQCVAEPDMFFCDGECMSKYDLNSMCAQNALVAKIAEQCEMPCVQSGSPPTGGGCSDKFDCNWQNGEVCEFSTVKERGLVGVCKAGNGGVSPSPPSPVPQVGKTCVVGNDCDWKSGEACVLLNNQGTCQKGFAIRAEPLTVKSCNSNSDCDRQKRELCVSKNGVKTCEAEHAMASALKIALLVTFLLILTAIIVMLMSSRDKKKVYDF